MVAGFGVLSVYTFIVAIISLSKIFNKDISFHLSGGHVFVKAYN